MGHRRHALFSRILLGLGLQAMIRESPPTIDVSTCAPRMAFHQPWLDQDSAQRLVACLGLDFSPGFWTSGSLNRRGHRIPPYLTNSLHVKPLRLWSGNQSVRYWIICWAPVVKLAVATTPADSGFVCPFLPCQSASYSDSQISSDRHGHIELHPCCEGDLPPGRPR